MTLNNSRHVVVSGGSIGGLCAGIALRGIGCEVAIYERVQGPMTSRGAGIVVQPELTALIHRYATHPLPMTSCEVRRYLHPDGSTREVSMPQQFTSWEAIYWTLHASFPSDDYSMGTAVTGFREEAERVVVQLESGREVEGGFLVCAEGSRSEARRTLLPEVKSDYAGYIAWRGTVEEAQVSPELATVFCDAFTFCEARSGGHVLCYLIPGESRAVEPGHRRLNWVWYVHAPEDHELPRLLTDREGQRRESSVPTGFVQPALAEEMRRAAMQELHPAFAELIRATSEPFIQAILDVSIPRMVFGRACLLGDAAFVVRPHTAAATAKAAADALALAEAVSASPTSLENALQIWERRRLQAGHQLLHYGLSLGSRVATPRR